MRADQPLVSPGFCGRPACGGRGATLATGPPGGDPQKTVRKRGFHEHVRGSGIIRGQASNLDQR